MKNSGRKKPRWAALRSAPSVGAVLVILLYASILRSAPSVGAGSQSSASLSASVAATQQIREDAAALRALRTEMAALRTDVRSMRTDLGDEMRSLRARVAGLAWRDTQVATAATTVTAAAAQPEPAAAAAAGDVAAMNGTSASSITRASPWRPGAVTPLALPDGSRSLRPRLDSRNVLVPGPDAFCERAWVKDGAYPDITWGALAEPDHASWFQKQCPWAALSFVLSEHLGAATTREAALAKAKELGWEDRLVRGKPLPGHDFEDEMIFFGPKAIVEQYSGYERKYPWKMYVCPGSLSLDIGTQWGDTLVSIASVAAGGVVFGFEAMPGPYLANEWEARLNPQLNIVPRLTGVKAGGAAEWGHLTQFGTPFRFRVIPVHAWLEQHLEEEDKKHIAFIKIDIEGFDKDVVRSMTTLTARSKPVILIEWLLDFRQSSTKLACDAKSEDIWRAAAAIGYDVWTWDATARLPSCADARQHFPDLQTCRLPGKGGDPCDLLLVPAGVDPGKERESLCPPPLTETRVRAIMRREAEGSRAKAPGAEEAAPLKSKAAPLNNTAAAAPPCPARCRSCEAGSAGDGGVAVRVDPAQHAWTVCEKFCSPANFCGTTIYYSSGGTDCSGCSTKLTSGAAAKNNSVSAAKKAARLWKQVATAKKKAARGPAT